MGDAASKGTAERRPVASDLCALFEPQTVAVVGATDDTVRSSGRVTRHLTEYGFGGEVLLVNPNRASVAGRTCYPSLSSLPQAPDLALVSLPAERCVPVLREAGAVGVRAAIVFAGGFAEMGEAGVTLQNALGVAAREGGVRLLGPNTAGLRSAKIRLFAEGGTVLAGGGFTLGTLAVVVQSGGIGGYFGSTHLRRLGAGTKYLVDTGNEVDVDAADALDYVSQDPEVTAVAVILEACRDGRKLVRAIEQAVGRGKRVLFMKVGRTSEGARAAQSHSAAMASDSHLLESEVAAVGGFVVRDELQLDDGLLLCDAGRLPRGRNLGIVTPSGGFGVMVSDIAGGFGLALPEPTVPPSDEFAESIGNGHIGNPLDMSGLFRPGTEVLSASLRYLGSQPNIDAVLLWHPHIFLSDTVHASHLPVLKACQEEIGKPLYHCGETTPEHRASMARSGILSFDSPTRLVAAIAAVTAASAGAASGQSTGTSPFQTASDGVVVTGQAARDQLVEMGIPSAPTARVTGLGDAEALLEKWGVPIYLKVETTAHSHKTEKGFVRGPLVGPSLREAFRELKAAADGDVAAELVAQAAQVGVELALGAYDDPAFGPVVMVAQGGIFVEVNKDSAAAAAPLTPTRAAQLLSELRIFPGLCGARGSHYDIDPVVDALVRLSEFIAAPENKGVTLDINPLIVRKTGEGVSAVDARIVRPPSGW
jgi:acetate---CoA ligase (ADP-forming)